MDKMTDEERKQFIEELEKPKGIWFSLNKGTVSFSKNYGNANSKDEVTVKFLMTYDEWKEISNYFSREKKGN